MKHRGYVILRLCEDEIHGYCEESLSMSFMLDRVRVWREWEGKTKIEDAMGNYMWINDRNKLVMFLQDRVKNLKKKHPEDDFRVFRIGSKNCPISIDWDSLYKEARANGGVRNVTKRNWRNLKFTARECIKVEDAMKS